MIFPVFLRRVMPAMKLKIGPKLLHIKLVSMFIGFGLLTAVLSTVLVTGFQTFSLFRDFSNDLGKDIAREFDTERPDFYYRTFAVDPRRSQALASFVERRIPPNFVDRVRITIYSSLRGERNWSEIVSLGGLKIEEHFLTIPEHEINGTIDNETFCIKPFLPGSETYKTVYLDLTDTDDSRHTVLRLIFMPHDFKTVLQNQKHTLMIFMVLVFLFSLLVGILFAGRLSVPIRELSSKAERMADGEMCVRFESKRKDDIGILARSMDTMSLSLHHRFESMQTMNRIDRAVLSSVSRRELLFNVAGYISEQFDHAAVAVLTHREEGLVLSAMIPHYEDLDDRLILYSSIKQYSSAGERDILEIEMESEDGRQVQNLRIFPPDMVRKKLAVIPILNEKKRAASFLITRDSFSDLDIEALGMLADQAGVALKSMVEVEHQEQMYQGTLMALTRSVDAKSRWTAGHSGRVARQAESLARTLELNKETIRTVRVAALLHDIGKLGIPEAILDKPGRLTDEEFAMIKSHPEKGDNIIKEIPGFEEIRLGVRHHHEKWDGSGYPDGLKGNEIPLIARILALADVYDAVTEDRPYRKGFSKERLAQFLEEQRAVLFDPELLDAFLPLVFEEES